MLWRALTAALAWLACAAPVAAQDAVTRGEYLVHAGGCVSCHTAPGGTAFAGGRALATPFGTFYSPNITPDLDTGIGRWTDAQFLRALRAGVRPDGANYFPVFPFPSFTNITDADALAIKAYLFSLPPVRQTDRPHDVAFPFSWRFLQFGWKTLFFREGPFRVDPSHDAAYNRGAYLVTALAHCGECHTPRNLFGAVKTSRGAIGNTGWTRRTSQYQTSPPIPLLASASGRTGHRHIARDRTHAGREHREGCHARSCAGWFEIS